MNEQYKKNFLRAGKLAGQVRAYGKSLITPGASYNKVIQNILAKIKELGATPAFPPQIALNEIAAHFLPWPDEDIVFEDEIVKLDIGVSYEGAIGDCAVTVDLSGDFQKLVEAVETALAAAEQIIEVGLPIREIGKTIDQTISSHGFHTIKNLSGHGLGINQIHTTPTIPNYDNRMTAVIRPGMTFAIEPFATDGKGMIFEEGKAAIFSANPSKKKIFEQQTPLLSKIKSFNGLPFAIHDLMNDSSSLQEIEQELEELERKGAIFGYAALVEEAYGIVAQAENSVLVDEQGKVFITTRMN